MGSAAFREGSHFTSDLARSQAHFPVSNVFPELLPLRDPPGGAPEAARPTSSADRQDLGTAGLLTPVVRVCHLGGSGTPSVPTHTRAAAVTKPKQRRAQPHPPPPGTPVSGRTMLLARLPEPGLGLTPMQGHKKREPLPFGENGNKEAK